MMSILERFNAYAEAFEVAYESDDFSILEPFFTEGAVYETLADPPLGGRQEGRDAIFAYMKISVAGFDRRFEKRELVVLEGPEVRGNEVWMKWCANYQSEGLPPLALEGEETATFEGDRICRLEDRWSSEAGKTVIEYMEAHGDSLA